MTIWTMFYLAIFVFIISVYFSFKMKPSKKRNIVKFFSFSIFSLIVISILFIGSTLYDLSICSSADGKFYEQDGVLCYGIVNASDEIKNKYNLSLKTLVIFDGERVILKGDGDEPYGAVYIKGKGIIIEKIKY